MTCIDKGIDGSPVGISPTGDFLISSVMYSKQQPIFARACRSHRCRAITGYKRF